MGMSTDITEAREKFNAMMSEKTPEERKKILIEGEEREARYLEREALREFAEACRSSAIADRHSNGGHTHWWK